MAGIWESWRGPDEQELESFAILTTRANGLVGEFHDRMPVILGREQIRDWISPEMAPEFLGEMMEPFSEDEMERTRVSTQVNNARNQGPEVLDRE
jgi:putative SOS response-associated peptidase YedK